MAIKISVELSHICPPDEIARHAAALEASGFHRVWVPDTAVSPWEAWLAASLIVQGTDRIQVGLGVTNPYTRHPVVVAQMAAMMQHLSGGRLTLSMGKGIGRFLDKAGVTRSDAAVEESIAILRGLMAGERVSFNGRAFHIDALRIRTIPPEKTVPIYLAAIGQAGWETAMQAADGVATIWSEKAAEIRRQVMAGRTIPAAALVPFSLSRDDFFQNRASSLRELEEEVTKMEKEGFDEAIIAYADMADLKAAAQLL